jgi:hypothetical protein
LRIGDIRVRSQSGPWTVLLSPEINGDNDGICGTFLQPTFEMKGLRIDRTVTGKVSRLIVITVSYKQGASSTWN